MYSLKFFFLIATCISTLASAAPRSIQTVYSAATPAITIVEFGDFQCPYCKRSNTVEIPQLIAQYGDKVRVVFRNYPLSFHANAMSAAIAGVCAANQGKFKEMYDFLYANYQSLGHDKYIEAAQKLALNQATFETCLNSSAAADQVNDDVAEGNLLSVDGTPAFFISGLGETRRLNGAYPIADFQKAIEAILTGK